MSVSKLYDQSLVLTKHKAYIDVLHKYLSHLSNFMTQGLHVIMVNPNLGRAAAGTEQELLRLASENGIKTDQGSLSTGNLHDSFVALKQLQTEFRNRFNRFLPADDLDRLEKKEKKLSRELWPVWYQFAFHPKRIEQNDAKVFVQECDDALKRVRPEIKRKLKALKQEDFSASVARTDLQFEGEEIPCVLIDISNPSTYWQAVKKTVLALQQALHTESNRSLRHYVIQFWMKRIAIVPLVRGKALSQSVFVVPTYALKSGGALKDWYHYIPQEVSDKDWAELSVPLWDREQFEPALRFVESLFNLSILTAQIGDLRRFSDRGKYDDAGIIDDFLQAQSENISKHLQRALDVGGELCSQLSGPQIDLEKRPFLGVALNLLIPICQQIQPAENYDGSMKITVDETKEWSERLEQIREQAEQFKLLWIADVLDQHATES